MRKTAERLLLAQLKKYALQMDLQARNLLPTVKGPHTASRSHSSIRIELIKNGCFSHQECRRRLPVPLPKAILLTKFFRMAAQCMLKQEGLATEVAPAEPSQPPTGDAVEVGAGSGSLEEETGPSQLPDTSGDALLAQQLAADMERGSYAKASCPQTPLSLPMAVCTAT